jgi:hypothetical protein
MWNFVKSFTEVEKYTIYLFISIQAICKVPNSHYELWLTSSEFPETMLCIYLNTMHVEMFHSSDIYDMPHDLTAYWC